MSIQKEDAASFTSLREALAKLVHELTREDSSNIRTCEALRNARAALSGVTQPATSTAANDVLVERERQKTVEGWTPEHDNTHTNFEMGRAAACYAYFATLPDDVREVASLGGSSAIDQVVVLRRMWRWHQDWWKPKDRRRDLVRAGALILAEIERLDRAEVEKISTDTEVRGS